MLLQGLQIVAENDSVACRMNFLDEDRFVEVDAESSPLADGVERIAVMLPKKVPLLVVEISGHNVSVGNVFL